MAFLIGGANSAADTGYDIDNSLRFNSADSSLLTWTPASAGNQKTWTLSVWVKRSQADRQDFIACTGDGSSNRVQICIESANIINIECKDGGSETGRLKTNGLFRDPSAWYHIVVAFDTTNATEDNRIRLYINGSEETSFERRTNPTQDADLQFNAAQEHNIGKRTYSSNYFDGYMADVYFIDGTQLTPSSFGETDEDSGIWKPKDAKDDLTFGTNGFYLEFKETGTNQDSSGIGADTSGEDNHWAVTNLAATDQTTDTPTNNFCTLNPNTNRQQTLSEGNTKTVRGGNDGFFCTSTFEVNKGKWYFESQLLNYSGDSRPTVGIAESRNSYRSVLANSPNNVAYFLLETDYYQSNGATAIEGVDTSPATNDIYHFAFDLDNLKFYIGKGNTWYHSSDPSAGSNGLVIQAAGYYAVATSPNDNGTDASRNNEWFFNFGNPAFAISSSNADANGYGNFEYAPPSGFYALCTKNLAEFG